MRSFPLTPRSVVGLEIGDFWTVELPSGGLGVLQVRDVKRSGSGARTSFVAGVIDWRGDTPPTGADLAGRAVLAQGLTVIEVFTLGGAVVLGNTLDTVPAPGLTSIFRDHGVGTRTSVWGWKSTGRVAERVLRDRR